MIASRIEMLPHLPDLPELPDFDHMTTFAI